MLNIAAGRTAGAQESDAAAVSGAAVIRLAVYPLVSTGMPEAGTSGTLDPAAVSTIIANGVSAASRASFEQVAISPPEGFDPSIPPAAADTDGDTLPDIQGCKYSLTSQVFYDTPNEQTQCQVWLYDNTTQSLVVTDQFIFPMFDSGEAAEDTSEDTVAEAPDDVLDDAPDETSEDAADETPDEAPSAVPDSALGDAEAVGPPLIDFVLSMIPQYTVTIRNVNNGKVIEGYSPNGTETADSSYSIKEPENLTLSAKPDSGWVFQGWRINGSQSLQTINPLTLVLNPQNYPGRPSAANPWGTNVAITVDAIFAPSADYTQEEGSGRTPWFIEANYQPGVPLFGRKEGYYSSTFLPLGLSLSAGLKPWSGAWGSAGLHLGASWVQTVNKEESTGATAALNVFNLGLGGFYRSPRLWNFLSFDGHAVFGLSHFTLPLISGDAASNYDGIKAWSLYLSPGLGAKFHLGQLFYINAGVNLDMTFFSDGIIGLLNPYAGVGLDF